MHHVLKKPGASRGATNKKSEKEDREQYGITRSASIGSSDDGPGFAENEPLGVSIRKTKSGRLQEVFIKDNTINRWRYPGIVLDWNN